MMQAAEAVEAGNLNLFRASKEIGVPRNMLGDRIRGDTGNKSYIKDSQSWVMKMKMLERSEILFKNTVPWTLNL
jgi:hypothetical protein